MEFPRRLRGGSNHNIVLWWQPTRSEDFGYQNGWVEDGSAFYYTGTGQTGDQVFGAPHAENGRVLEHVDNRDSIRLVRYLGKNLVDYLGELRLDPQAPYRDLDGLGADGNVRRMIQFRFLPVGRVKRYAEDPTIDFASDEQTVADVSPVPDAPSESDVEALATDEFVQRTRTKERIAKRRETMLVHQFRDWLNTRGVRATGLSIPYLPQHRNLKADLYVPEVAVLIEAKASSSRESIRAGIGQLLDYERFINPRPVKCLLLPTPPPPDMISLLESLVIGVVWSAHPTFLCSPGDVLKTMGA